MDMLRWDNQHLWHPFTQHHTAPTPPLVVRAAGTKLFLRDGRVVLDAISSWWVNLHGHCHPYLVAVLSKQAAKLEQVIFADFTHEEAIAFTQALIPLLPPGLERVFFSDNGSTAVEVALKIALQYWHNRNEPKRKFVALAGAYHGDTFGAMAVGERSAFTSPFAPLLFEVLRIASPQRGSAAPNSLIQLDQLLARHHDIAGFIYEPLVQGASGMIMHDAAVLGQLIARAQQAGIICIADEVMTGFGRTGMLFASSQLPLAPDIICLGKGITAGMLPLSVTVAAPWIFEAFLSERKEQAFLHGHSFTANSLGCRVGLASLELLTSPESFAARQMIENEHRRFKARLEESPEGAYFSDIRVQGTILACELKTSEGSGYFSGLRDAMARYFIEQGVLLRPLGNVVYVLPPYCITAEELHQAYGAITSFVRSYF